MTRRRVRRVGEVGISNCRYGSTTRLAGRHRRFEGRSGTGGALRHPAATRRLQCVMPIAQNLRIEQRLGGCSVESTRSGHGAPCLPPLALVSRHTGRIRSTVRRTRAIGNLAAHREENTVAIEVSRALPSEYAVILNNLPKEWFAPEPYLLHLQVAEMVNASRFLIAHDGENLVGTIGWQDNVAFGAFYEKFLFVKPEFRKEGVAAMLWRELLEIAADTGQRAIFCDIPEGSPLIRSVRQVPGAREVGAIEDFHGSGVKSLIFALDVKGSRKFTTYADRLIAESSDHTHS